MLKINGHVDSINFFKIDSKQKSILVKFSQKLYIYIYIYIHIYLYIYIYTLVTSNHPLKFQEVSEKLQFFKMLFLWKYSVFEPDLVFFPRKMILENCSFSETIWYF